MVGMSAALLLLGLSATPTKAADSSWVVRKWHCENKLMESQFTLTVSSVGREFVGTRKLGPFPGKTEKGVVKALEASTPTLTVQNSRGEDRQVTAQLVWVTTSVDDPVYAKFFVLKTGNRIALGTADDKPEMLAQAAVWLCD